MSVDLLEVVEKVLALAVGLGGAPGTDEAEELEVFRSRGVSR